MIALQEYSFFVCFTSPCTQTIYFLRYRAALSQTVVERYQVRKAPPESPGGLAVAAWRRVAPPLAAAAEPPTADWQTMAL